MKVTLTVDFSKLKRELSTWAGELGFQQVGVSDIDLDLYAARLNAWLADGHHGEMSYMSRHGSKRYRPDELIDGTCRIISVRMNYLPESQSTAIGLLDHPSQAYVSRYALGRDYHKLIRKRLGLLAEKITVRAGAFGYRVFVDSAPVLEKPIAEKAGLGWIGKHTNLINSDAGSWFFLGEIYTDLPLPVDAPASAHCGTCRACIDVCPTDAIVAPFKLDARRCISYLTIEHQTAIPEELRKPIGNRIYGCDDCQLFCPWNKFAQPSDEGDFSPRHHLDDIALTELATFDESAWLTFMEGSAIRRIGFERWQRNLAVALGNAKTSDAVMDALRELAASPSELVREHAEWGIDQHQ